jgi:K+-sensing histidine kinase KdpD
LNAKPEVVIVDELAHSNIEGSKNEKRWQDVMDILNAGINVISAVNIQHIESLNDEVKEITGVVWPKEFQIAYCRKRMRWLISTSRQTNWSQD